MGASMNAGRSNKRVSIFGMFELEDEKKTNQKGKRELNVK